MLDKLRANLPYMKKYLLIGGFVFLIDFSLYGACLSHHWTPFHAVSASQAVAMLIHYNLNKHFNFRSYEHPTHEQFVMYLLVAFFCIGVSNAVVWGWIFCFGSSTTSLMLAKCAAVGVNIPIGFIGHKKLTFGKGLRGLLGRKVERAA